MELVTLAWPLAGDCWETSGDSFCKGGVIRLERRHVPDDKGVKLKHTLWGQNVKLGPSLRPTLTLTEVNLPPDRRVKLFIWRQTSSAST